MSRAVSQLVGDVHAAEVSGAASVNPTIPNRPGPDRDDEHHERVQPERRAHDERLDHLLKRAVRQQRDDCHDERSRRPLGAERDQHREGAGDPRADERHVGRHERDDRDRPRERHAEDQRRRPDDDAVERRDDRHAEEVAAQRLGDVGRDDVGDRLRHAHVPVDEAVHHGPSLSTNSVLSVANPRKNSSDVRPSMPVDPSQRRADLGSGLLHVLVGVLGVVDAEVAEPALDLVQRLVELRRDLGRVGGYTAEHEEKMRTPRATIPSRTRIAPPIRGTRWRSSQPTAGPATAPSTAARITGMTIVDVWLSSQITPTMISTKPTSSHEEKPRFLSHPGAEACGTPDPVNPRSGPITAVVTDHRKLTARSHHPLA